MVLCRYEAIGIMCNFSHSTKNGRGVYNVYFCESSGMIHGPFKVIGDYLAYWSDGKLVLSTKDYGKGEVRWIINVQYGKKAVIENMTKVN